MKFLLITLALLVTMPAYTSDERPQAQAKVKDLLEKYKTQEVSPTAALERENIQLKNEVRELRRRAYVAEQNLKKAQEAHHTANLYTEEQVQGIIDNTYNEIYSEFLSFRVAERDFLLSLNNVEQGLMVVQEMNKMDHEQLLTFHGNEEYKKDIAAMVAEYKEYFGLKLQEIK